MDVAFIPALSQKGEVGCAESRRRRERLRKTLNLVPAGVCPIIRAESNFDLVVCALDSRLVSALDSELEHRPDGELRLQANLQDPATRQLMTLLIADAKEVC